MQHCRQMLNALHFASILVKSWEKTLNKAQERKECKERSSKATLKSKSVW